VPFTTHPSSAKVKNDWSVYLFFRHIFRGVDTDAFVSPLCTFMHHIKIIDYSIHIITHFGLYWRRTAFSVR